MESNKGNRSWAFTMCHHTCSSEGETYGLETYMIDVSQLNQVPCCCIGFLKDELGKSLIPSDCIEIFLEALASYLESTIKKVL